MRDIFGAKGDSGGGSTSEIPDSLHSTAYAKVVDFVSEGEIEGFVNGLQSMYLNGTPIQNPDGSENFTGYTIDWRWGTQDQTYLSGFPAVENEHAVGVELKDTQPWTQVITDLSLSAVRVLIAVPQLQQSDPTKGIIGYRVEYAIDLDTDGGGFQQVLTGAFDGKASSEYERSIRIELPTAKTEWTLRVRRLTPNANSSLIADTVNIESYTEVIDAKLRYPMSAVIGLQIDSSQFQSVPTRSFHLRGRIIKVPSNYDPIERTYSGAWDGTFKLAWTNNPAWIFYDLVLNDRYGLGQRINASQIDKWGLYAIAQYCDVMVSDGKGGQEPRFTCNVYLQTAADAYQVLQDIAGIFRGMAYWASSQVFAVADMPGDVDYIYTAANTVGQFKYAGSPRSKRFTVALVSWNDPSDQYKQKVEAVPDDEGIARYGVQQTSITAFGCTSQGQAQRAGRWLLLTSRLETETLTHQVGLDGTLVMPGTVFGVADPKRAGARNGGRIRAVNGRTVTLDKAPVVNVGDSLTIILPTGKAEKHSVQSVNGDDVTVVDDIITPPVAQSVWMIESTELVAQTFRCLSVAEQDGIIFEITSTQHEPGKFDAIDNGTRIDPRPISIIPPSVQPPPSNVRFSTCNIIDQGIARTVMTIAWDAADKAVAYNVQWRKDSGEWVNVPQTGSLSVDVVGIYEGDYVATVRAVGATGVVSLPVSSALTPLQGKTTPPPAVTFLRTTSLVFGIQLDWGFPDGAADTGRTEIWYSKTASMDDAQKFSDFAYPQITTTYQGLAAGQTFFFWARLVDRSGNIGPWYPAGAGVQGSSSSDSTEILTYLAGQISKTQLGQDVLGPVNAIPGIQQSVSDNASAISQETSDRINAVTAEAAARAQAISAEATARGAAITTEQQTRQDADSSLSSRIDTVTASTGANGAAIQGEVQARTDADTALGQRIDTVVGTVGANTSAISQEATARADADSALGQRIDTVTATANGNTTSITQEQAARANADTALGQRIDSVTATADGNTSAITQEQLARVNGDAANAGAISSLTSTVDANTSAISNEATTRAQADSALSTQINQISAQLNVPMAGDNGGYAGSTTVYAGVYSEQSARVEADLAQAQKTDAVNAQLQTTINGVSTTLTAQVQTESQARAAADSAMASQVTTVQAQAASNAAAVQTVAQSYATLNGQVSASYTIRTQVTTGGRTYIAGIGIGVDNSSGVVESQVLVSAQRFAILDASGSTVASPFIVQGGQVFLAQAFIGTGWITSAMIGSYIQSDNYVPGVSGWRLDKTGNFEINSTDGAGNRLRIDSNGGLGWDANGVLRYEWGFWTQ